MRLWTKRRFMRWAVGATVVAKLAVALLDLIKRV